jgi:hypothetical protein
MEELKTQNISDVLKLLKQADLTDTFEVYVPSQQANIKFKQLNAEQLKRLLKTVIDSPIYNTEFITTFNTIIKENCIDETVNIKQLTVFDKLLILVKTRIESVSPEYKFLFSKEEIDENKITNSEYTVNIKNVYDNFVQNQPNYQARVFTHNSYTLTCSLPTIDTENKLESELHKNIKLEISTPEELRTTLGDTFINELTKYIYKLKIEDTEIDFETLNFKSRIKIVEQLPTIAINNVLKYIEGYKKLINPLTSYNIPTETDITFNKEIPQDATFFNM